MRELYAPHCDVFSTFFIRLFLIAHLSGQSSRSLKFLPRKKQMVVGRLLVFYPHRQRWFCRLHLPEMLLAIANARTEAELEKHDLIHACKPSVRS
jgi:hypothetical protein